MLMLITRGNVTAQAGLKTWLSMLTEVVTYNSVSMGQEYQLTNQLVSSVESLI